MNKENMTKLLKHLERKNNPVKFDMERFFSHGANLMTFNKDAVIDIVENHPCGTAACLAGHAGILAWSEGECLDINDIELAAEKWLDISGEELFYGGWKTLNNGLGNDDPDLGTLCLSEAITEVKHIIKTGDVAEYEGKPFDDMAEGLR